ncbi:MAG: AIPR family protein [Metamycoplasmataceae bacterium]
MENIEVLKKYSNKQEFKDMKDELKFSLFAVDNEFFEGNATFEKVSEFVYDLNNSDPIIDLLLTNADGDAIILAKTIMNENFLEIKNIINNIFLETSTRNSELFTAINDEKTEDTIEIVLFICLSNNLTKESFDSLIKHYDKELKNHRMKIIFKTINDILLMEKENSEAMPFVKSHELIIDMPNNYLKFDKNNDLSGIVVNVDTNSIKELYDAYYQKGLLGANIRYFVRNKQIDTKIKETLLNESDFFWFKNNGILIIAKSYEIKENKILLKNFSIVNGGQTTYLLGEIKGNLNAYVLCRIIAPKEIMRNENKLIADIAEATNSQKPIKKQDIIANYQFVRELKENLLHTSKFQIMLEIKRGEKRDTSIFPKNYNYIKSTAFAGLIVSTLQINPGRARNAVGALFSSEDSIQEIFNPKINQNFYQDLIYIWNMYEDYIKVITKKNNLSKKRIRANKLMKFYTISTTYVYYLLATDQSFSNKVKHILTSSITPIKDIMELIINIDTKNFKGMLKIYDKNEIFDLFTIIHGKLDYCFDILSKAAVLADKPFDMANITKIQKNFGEHFIIRLIQAFLEEDNNTIAAQCSLVFSNK